MFNGAKEFNQPLDEWNLSSVITMESMFDGAKQFNQCLSTWAGDTIKTVDTEYMFYDTACPSLGTPERNQAPWCQTNAEQCYDPLTSRAPSDSPTDSSSSPSTEPERGPCDDDSTFKKRNKNCNKFLKNIKKRSVNCLRKYQDQLVEDFCPTLCKIEQCTCKDKIGKFKVKGETKKLKGIQIKRKGLCSDGKSKEGKPLKELCPKKCRSKNEVCFIFM